MGGAFMLNTRPFLTMSEQTAISPKRHEDFPEWYQQVIRAADLAENSEVRGCMVIKPWGYALWERMQSVLDGMFKATGHRNAYFPLFIPLSYLEREAAHVEGFAKECAVVTHHRLESKEGKLVPAGKLTEPLVVRPTSETSAQPTRAGSSRGATSPCFSTNGQMLFAGSLDRDCSCGRRSSSGKRATRRTRLRPKRSPRP